MEYIDDWSFSFLVFLPPLCGDMYIHTIMKCVAEAAATVWIDTHFCPQDLPIMVDLSLSGNLLYHWVTSWHRGLKFPYTRGEDKIKKLKQLLFFASNRTSYNNMSIQFTTSWAFLSIILLYLNKSGAKYVSIRKPFCLSMKTHINESAQLCALKSPFLRLFSLKE